jgi:glutamate 5-kinase
MKTPVVEVGEAGSGVALMDADPDVATEVAVAGAAVEPAYTPMAQKERPVDILKVGGKILAYERFMGEGVSLNDITFETVGQEIARDSGDIALVTSAAISTGMKVTGLKKRPDKDTQMPELQRLSSVGRRHIENAWAEALPGREIGGLSLTGRELDDVARREEALRVIQALFRHREVPVINENDAITHDEISFGSNDVLAARLAGRMQESDLFGTVRLFLLTDVNGVYDRKPGTPPFFEDKGDLDPRARIAVIEDTDRYQHLAGGADDKLNIGGMESKFKAADIAKAAGVDMWIYNPAFGHREQAVNGEMGTYFPASA